MCVFSAVMDHYKPEFDKWYQPPTFTPFETIKPTPAPDLATQLETLAKLIAEFKEAVAAAKTVDRLTAQPDCEDPEKRKLEDRVAELEHIMRDYFNV